MVLWALYVCVSEVFSISFSSKSNEPLEWEFWTAGESGEREARK